MAHLDRTFVIKNGPNDLFRITISPQLSLLDSFILKNYMDHYEDPIGFFSINGEICPEWAITSINPIKKFLVSKGYTQVSAEQFYLGYMENENEC